MNSIMKINLTYRTRLNIYLVMFFIYCSIALYGQDVHYAAMPGSLSVSEMGSAIYSLPIDLPPGRGLSPELSFRYNSNSGNSLMGEGWGIIGLSSITRANPTDAFNGFSDNIDFIDDQLLYDGVPLVKIKQEPNGIQEFRTSQDNLSRIMYIPNGISSAYDHFIVNTIDGRTLVYGNNGNSRCQYLENNSATNPLMWCIQSEEDRFGNIIDYTYLKDSSHGSLIPKSIIYPMDDDIDYIVTFNYDSLFLLNSSVTNLSERYYYEKNGQIYNVRTNSILSNIEVKTSNGQVLTSYNMNYFENNPETYFYHLNKISKTKLDVNTNELVNLPPTTFDWNFYKPNYETSITATANLTSVCDGSTNSCVIDYEGTGYFGYVTFMKRLINDPTIIPQKFECVVSVYSPKELHYKYSIPIIGFPDFLDMVAADMDGDGKQELLMINDGKLIIYSLLKYSYVKLYEIDFDGEFVVIDSNMDGINDLLLNSNGNIHLLLGTNLKDGFQEGNNISVGDKYLFKDLADFNGDGYLDILLINKTSNVSPLKILFINDNNIEVYCQLPIINDSAEVVVGDFNGDAKGDIYIFNKGSTVNEILFFYGDGYKRVPITSAIPTSFISMSDVNNDGRTDFIDFSSLRGLVVYYTSLDGTSAHYEIYDCLGVNGLITNIVPVNLDNTNAFDFVFETVKLVKINIDSTANSDVLSYYKHSIFKLADEQLGRNLVKSITEGGVKKTSLEFIQPKRYGVDLVSFPLKNGNLFTPLLHKIYVQMGRKKNILLKEFSFSNPVSCIKGNQFIGYFSYEEIDYSKNTKILIDKVLVTDSSTYYYLLPQNRKVFAIANSVHPQDLLLNETFSTYGLLSTVPTKKFIHKVVPLCSFSRSWDLSGAFIKTDKVYSTIEDYDIYGNCKRNVVLNSISDLDINVADDRYDFQTESSDVFVVDPLHLEKWILTQNIYSKRIRTDYVSSKRRIDEVFNTYYGINELNSSGIANSFLLKSSLSVPDSNSVFSMVKRYDYDRYGNIIKLIESPLVIDSTVHPRVTEFKYSKRYFSRFLTSMTVYSDSISFENEFGYNNLFGYRTSERNIDGKISTTTYDVCGRVISTTDFNGIRSNVKYLKRDNFGSFTPENCFYGIHSYKITSDSSSEEYENSITFIDSSGNVIRQMNLDCMGGWIYKDLQYDSYNRLVSSSHPIIITEPAVIWDKVIYDELGRPVKMFSDAKSVSILYDGRFKIEKNDITNVWSKTEVNSLGNIINKEDPAGKIFYYYLPSGIVEKIVAGGVATEYKYYSNGSCSQIISPTSGIKSFVVNAVGQVLKEVDSKNNTKTYKYDAIGRLKTKSLGNGQVINYLYNNDIQLPGFGLMNSIELSSGEKVSFDYDTLGRISTILESYKTNSFKTSYSYDPNKGYLQGIVYPQGFSVHNIYGKNGTLIKVQESISNKTIWEVTSTDMYGNISNSTLGDNIFCNRSYDENGYLQSIRSSRIDTSSQTRIPIQDLEYHFDPATGNLLERADLLYDNRESFTYDALLQSRLSTWQVKGQDMFCANYSGRGNITKKTGITNENGMYLYNKPYSVYSISNPTNVYLNNFVKLDEIQYSPTNKVTEIAAPIQKGVPRSLKIFYGPTDVRYKSIYKINDAETVKYYSITGLFEYIVPPDHNASYSNNYIITGEGKSAIFIQRKIGGSNLNFILRDHLGSYDVVTDEDGNEIERFSFDPWGKRRNAYDWSFNNVPSTPIFQRGFTDHEHLDVFGLINMNGRMYDPALGRFISPDNRLSDGAALQDFNSYSYCANNPLKYIDPSGYWRVNGVVSESYRFHKEVSFWWSGIETVFRGEGRPSLCRSRFGFDSMGIWKKGVNSDNSGSSSPGTNSDNSIGWSVVEFDGVIYLVLYDCALPQPEFEEAPNGALRHVEGTPEALSFSEWENTPSGDPADYYFASVSGGKPAGQEDAPSYLDNALKFEGAPYLYGGMTKDGIDCSGLVNRATGNERRVWTTSMGNPPGNWSKVTVRTSSYDNFIADVNKGDLFVWPKKHTAFYAGNGMLFHAHGKTGTKTGYTDDLNSFWIQENGYPDVYRP